ncbi:MAG: 1-(5-phosphoribosyl)-5-[(5-phosphoribosylamino)methylideneamino]imidazole-4-carboxamide isomerase [Acidobacteria bacterium]|nr:1-(5-phosphoribosyl)-5-[(5-phosphoribosylamino)methylideneamino]imidazole-4-carboxamide isomerase [Acidobacteriota bacterium]
MLIIPAIDLIDGKCVRLVQGDYSRQTTYSGEPVEHALKFQAARFPRLHLIDLQGARDGIPENAETIRNIIQSVQIPVQVGGGIREALTVQLLLEWGANYLILATVAINEPHKVDEWVRRWGPEQFIVSFDLRGGKLQTKGWTEDSPVDLDQLLERCANWGIQQLVCTDVERDGTLEQPNFGSYSSLIRKIPEGSFLIAAGGISHSRHLSRLRDIGVNGVVVGRAMYEGKIRWEELAGVS